MGALEKSPEVDADLEPTGARSRLESRVVRLTFGFTLLPFMVGVVALLVDGYGSYHPVSDLAYVAVFVDDVLGHTPLVGQYSRDGWSHPGPSQFYVLAPFSWAVGGDPIGIRLGALVVNGVCVTGMVWLALRRGGLSLMLVTAVATSTLSANLGGEFLNDPWNLFLPVLPYALLIFLVWSMAVGDRWAFPFAVFVASFAAQTHVGFVALAIPLVAWGTAWLVAGTARGSGTWRDLGDRRTVALRLRVLLMPCLVGGVVLVVVWLPTMIDAITRSPSNVWTTLEWFSNAEGGVATVADGWRVVAGQFGSDGEWLAGKRAAPVGTSPYLAGPSPVPWFLLGGAIACVALWRTGTSVHRHLVGVWVVAFVSSVAAVARTVGPIVDYRLRWTWVLPMITMILIVWALWLELERRRPSLAKPIAVAVLVPLVLLSGVNSVTALHSGNPGSRDSEVVATLGADTDQALAAKAVDDGVVLLLMGTPLVGSYTKGLVHYLERAGVEVRVDRTYANRLGEHRTYRGEDLALVLVVMSGPDVDQYLATDGLTPVAQWPPGILDEDRRPSQDAVAAFEEIFRSYEQQEIWAPEYNRRYAELIDESTDQATASWMGRIVVFIDDRPPGEWPQNPWHSDE